MDEPPTKRRKLPPLDVSFSPPEPVQNDAAKHQGRIREVPHVKGQWACHVFIELAPSVPLRKVLQDAYELVSVDNGVHSLLESESPLHISLSRPLILQSSQRDELRTGIAATAVSFGGFQSRYAVFDVLENDPKTRRFLGIELGTGWSELRAIVTSIDNVLAKMRLPMYYEAPRFHTSIAWTTKTSKLYGSDIPFSKGELEQLEIRFGKRLRREEMWVGELCLKIGKDVVRFKLRGARTP